MKVKELIKRLEKEDPNMEVRIYCQHEWFDQKIIKVMRGKNNRWNETIVLVPERVPVITMKKC